MNRETVIDKYTVPRLKRATSENPPYSTGGSAPCSVRTSMGRESGKECTYTCVSQTHLAGQ